MPAVKFAVDAPQRTKKSTDDKETDWATSFSIQWRKYVIYSLQNCVQAHLNMQAVHTTPTCHEDM